MMLEEIRSGGCCSYVVACGETCAGVVVDPELSQMQCDLWGRRIRMPYCCGFAL